MAPTALRRADPRRGAPIRDATTAVVLCGGRATRLGGVEKPLADLGGQPLVCHVLGRLAPQVEAVVLAGAGPESYRRFGHRVVADSAPNQGPLGGIVSALAVVATPWVLTAPADTPFLPTNLVAKLAAACPGHGAAVAEAGGRRQNLSLLVDATRAASLAAFFATGGRAVHRWLDANRVPTVAFPAADFLNVNTAADLRAARRMLSG